MNTLTLDSEETPKWKHIPPSYIHPPRRRWGGMGGGNTSTGLQLRKEGQDKISETRRQLTDILAIRCQMF